MPEVPGDLLLEGVPEGSKMCRKTDRKGRKGYQKKVPGAWPTIRPFQSVFRHSSRNVQYLPALPAFGRDVLPPSSNFTR